MLAPSLDTTTQEYRTAKGYRIFIYLLMPPLIVLFLALPFLLMRGKNPSLGLAVGFGVLGLGLAALLMYGLVETIKDRLIIQGEAVSQVGVFKTNTLALGEISGYRTDDKYTHIYPHDKQKPTLKIGYTTERYEEIQLWLADRYPDLDQVETEQATDLLLEDHDLGRTPEERAEALAQAKTKARVLNVAGVVAGAWAIFYPQPYQWAIGASILFPVAVTVVVCLSSTTLRIDEQKNTGYPSVLYALVGPVFGLMMRALFDYELVSYEPLWPLVGATTTGAALMLAIGSRIFLFRRKSALSVGFTILFLALIYGYGATSVVNAVYDEGEVTTYTPQVLGKHYSSGKHTSYYLNVTAWGPVATAEDVQVSRDYYQQVQEGQKVTIALMPGRLGVPWFTVLE
ncbi:hypothetical protein [Hymenobacter sp. B1770]|uniref:hypothetical protein n=1 Tax=Hymenobacter sp. B1770 TaxID=1718788 RepID=UPI003CEE480F